MAMLVYRRVISMKSHLGLRLTNDSLDPNPISGSHQIIEVMGHVPLPSY